MIIPGLLLDWITILQCSLISFYQTLLSTSWKKGRDIMIMMCVINKYWAHDHKPMNSVREQCCSLKVNKNLILRFQRAEITQNREHILEFVTYMGFNGSNPETGWIFAGIVAYVTAPFYWYINMKTCQGKLAIFFDVNQFKCFVSFQLKVTQNTESSYSA